MKGIVKKLNNEWVVKCISMPTFPNLGRKVEHIYYPLEIDDYLNDLKQGDEVDFYLFDKSTSLSWDSYVVAKIKTEEEYLKIPLSYINKLIEDIDEEKSINDAFGSDDLYEFCRGKIEVLEFLKEKFLK